LIRKNTMFAAMEFSRCARSNFRREFRTLKPAEPVSQNSTAWHVEVDVIPGEPRHRTIIKRSSTVAASQPRFGCLAANDELDAYGSKSSRIP
jgi:hypothetical protein